MKNANDVVISDLDYICSQLQEELPLMSGKRLLITGGAGFLGYYLTQSIFHWNNTNPDKPPIDLVVYDNFMRGVPEWLETLAEHSFLTVKNMTSLTPCLMIWVIFSLSFMLPPLLLPSTTGVIPLKRWMQMFMDCAICSITA